MSKLAIRHIAFLTPGNYDDADPRAGLEETLALFEHGEALGFDSAWVRQRHLEPGVSSAATFLAAASQRTSRIGLGTAVIQIGYENPFRLAEDLSLVDLLSGVAVSMSASAPVRRPLASCWVSASSTLTRDFMISRMLASPGSPAISTATGSAMPTAASAPRPASIARACARMHRVCASDSGMVAVHCVRPAGPARTASSCWSAISIPARRPMISSSRSAAISTLSAPIGAARGKPRSRSAA